jgi:hypothetical protein
MFNDRLARMRCAMGLSRWSASATYARSSAVISLGAARIGGCLVLAAALVLCLLPAVASADPPHGRAFQGHFAEDHGPRAEAHFGGPRWHAGDGGWHRGGDWHGGGDRWHGGRGDWHGDGERWHAGWEGRRWGGDDWDHRDWDGALWLGGYWGGRYWPPVDYGWSYPWFMASIPFGAMSISFGGVPYYYINHVYYAWNPYYDGYVVTDPPPVAGVPAAAPPPGSAPVAGGRGVLALRVTPLKGQDAQQTANDRYACNTWAVAQSGFDPLNAQQDAQASPQMRGDYRRAFTACLHARGYSVH